MHPPHASDLTCDVPRATNVAEDVNLDEPVRAQFYEALGLYNRGEYLRCQEALEQVYAGSAAEEQALVRGLLMLACGMHLHFHRGGGKGVLNLLRQSLIALEDFRPRRVGVDVTELYDALGVYLEDLQDRRKPGAGLLDRWLAPRIRYRAEP